MEENKIKVNTGAKTYTIYDSDNEVLGRFKFNPSDFGIIRRAEEVQKKISELKLGESVNELFAVDSIIREQFDYLLNYPVSDALFSKATPTTFLENGELYFESVFDAVTSLIEESVEKRSQKAQKRIRDATAAYKTEE